MSIRTKILMTFISLILLSLGIFFTVASTSFRKDKLAYIYDSNQILTEGKSYAVLSVLSSWRSVVQAIFPYVNTDGKSISGVGLNVWQSVDDLRSLTITHFPDGAPLFHDEKTAEKPDRAVARFRYTKENGFEIVTASNAKLVNPPENSWMIEGTFRVDALTKLLKPSGDVILMLADGNGHSVLPVDASVASNLGQLAADINLASRTSETVEVSFLGEKWFMGIYSVPRQNLKVLAFSPEAILNRLLHDLLIRSLVVCLLVLLLVTGMTVLLSRGITRNLELLSQAVQTIGKGHFDFKLNIKSKDETSRLATAFKDMSNEIKTLLVKTADQSRMEEELKTGQLVQSTLFPFEGLTAHQVEIKGFYQSATECGGDWWYYKYENGFLYAVVADATGHGVPAALITSGARAAFSLVAWSKAPSAGQVAMDLNRAIYNVSKGQVLMTALVIKLNVATGHLEVANCSHEAMIQYDGKGDTNMILPVVSGRLGEKEEMEIEIEHLFLDSGHSLFVYTDGLKDLKTNGKRALGDKQLLRLFKNCPINAEKAVSYVLDAIELANQEYALKDDVTFVVIHRV